MTGGQALETGALVYTAASRAAGAWGSACGAPASQPHSLTADGAPPPGAPARGACMVWVRLSVGRGGGRSWKRSRRRPVGASARRRPARQAQTCLISRARGDRGRPVSGERGTSASPAPASARCGGVQAVRATRGAWVDSCERPASRLVACIPKLPSKAGPHRDLHVSGLLGGRRAAGHVGGARLLCRGSHGGGGGARGGLLGAVGLLVPHQAPRPGWCGEESRGGGVVAGCVGTQAALGRPASSSKQRTFLRAAAFPPPLQPGAHRRRRVSISGRMLVVR